MDSAEIDAYLVVREIHGLEPIRAMGNGPLAVTVHDDNGGGGTNARVAVAVKRGLWVITAQGKKRGSHGSYRLTVKCDVPP
jgi:hypothetical protein